MVLVNLPAKRHKIFICNLSQDRVKEFEHFVSSWNKLDQISDKEYLFRENNYRLTFTADEYARDFVDWLRSTDGNDYEAKIYTENVLESIRDKFKHKIRQIEMQQSHQNSAEGNLGFMEGQIDPMQLQMMQMMYMNMFPNQGNGKSGPNSGIMNPMQMFYNMGQGGMGGNPMGNPNMMGKKFAGGYHRHNDMFVRKAKNPNRDTPENSASNNNPNGTQFQNNANNSKHHINNPNRKNYNNNNGKRNSYTTPTTKPQNQNPATKQYPSTKTDDSNTTPNQNEPPFKKTQPEKTNRPRMGSNEFPALPFKTLQVHVPSHPLTEEDTLTAIEKIYSKDQFIKKFQEFKDSGKLAMAKELLGPELSKVPVILKDGDLRLECLEATPWLEPEIKSSGGPSRKVSHSESPRKDSNGGSSRKWSSPGKGECMLTRSRKNSENVN
jgi:hypothetical protein